MLLTVTCTGGIQVDAPYTVPSPRTRLDNGGKTNQPRIEAVTIETELFKNRKVTNKLNLVNNYSLVGPFPQYSKFQTLLEERISSALSNSAF